MGSFRNSFEFLRTDAAQVAVAARSIVKQLDVVSDIRPCDLPVLVDPLLDSFLLQAAEEGFRDGVDAPMSSKPR